MRRCEFLPVRALELAAVRFRVCRDWPQTWRDWTYHDSEVTFVAIFGPNYNGLRQRPRKSVEFRAGEDYLRRTAD